MNKAVKCLVVVGCAVMLCGCGNSENRIEQQVFEKATMEIAAPKVIVHMEDKKDKEIDCTGTNGYFNEIAYFSECILKNRRPVTASVESTRDSIRIVLAEEKSARTNRKVFLKK